MYILYYYYVSMFFNGKFWNDFGCFLLYIKKIFMSMSAPPETLICAELFSGNAELWVKLLKHRDIMRTIYKQSILITHRSINTVILCLCNRNLLFILVGLEKYTSSVPKSGLFLLESKMDKHCSIHISHWLSQQSRFIWFQNWDIAPEETGHFLEWSVYRDSSI